MTTPRPHSTGPPIPIRIGREGWDTPLTGLGNVGGVAVAEGLPRVDEDVVDGEVGDGAVVDVSRWVEEGMGDNGGVGGGAAVDVSPGLEDGVVDVGEVCDGAVSDGPRTIEEIDDK